MKYMLIMNTPRDGYTQVHELAQGAHRGERRVHGVIHQRAQQQW